MAMSKASSHDHSYFLHLTFFLFSLLVVDGAHDYKDALGKSITFFSGQRSGKLPPPSGQDIPWRGDSALKDGQTIGMDLTGGYYDAGDNEKFNFPMAFTTTLLSWSWIEFGKNMGPDESARAREAIRWATDYLLKSASKVASLEVLYVGVGNGDTDHGCWERPEDIDGDTQGGGGAYRDVYSVSASNRGGDIAGETAAALSAASIVFRNVDRAYSTKLLATAKDVMRFAMAYRGGNSDNYYRSYSGDTDEMVWGAAWLLRATKDANTYLNYNKSLGASDDVDLFSWENKYAGANVLLSRRFLVKNNSDPSAQEYSKKAETFMCKILSHSYSTSSTMQYTPGGLMYKSEGGSNLQYTTSITFLMTTYAKYMASMKHSFSCGSTLMITSKVLRDLAKAQVDYILGDNPNKMSYMVGYGNKYPQRIHHRGSSIPSIKAHPTPLGCHGGDSYRTTEDPNPNVLTGAIVGGPGGDDSFADDRNNFAQSEPATYINAPFVGTVAYIAGRQK